MVKKPCNLGKYCPIYVRWKLRRTPTEVLCNASFRTTLLHASLPNTKSPMSQAFLNQIPWSLHCWVAFFMLYRAIYFVWMISLQVPCGTTWKVYLTKVRRVFIRKTTPSQLALFTANSSWLADIVLIGWVIKVTLTINKISPHVHGVSCILPLIWH